MIGPMDTIHRFLLEDLDIRGALVRLGPAWREMQAGRRYAPPVRDLLGELAAVTTLIASNLKTPGRLTFQLQGNGPVRLLVVDCDERLRMRGMAQAPHEVAPLDLPGLLGDGRLVLTLQGAASPQPYQSLVPLAGDSVAAVFEHYLEQSEQLPSRLVLGSDADSACGLFLQKLPEADRKDADGWNRVGHLAATIGPADLRLPAEDLLTRVFPEEAVRLFAPQSVAYHCPRNEEKALDMVRTLGRDEVETLLAEQGEVLIHDEICNHEYRFGPEVLDQAFPPPERTLH